MVHTKAGSTGRLIHLLFIGLLVAENGKIKLLRESINTVANAQALNPNGAADLGTFNVTHSDLSALNFGDYIAGSNHCLPTGAGKPEIYYIAHSV